MTLNSTIAEPGAFKRRRRGFTLVEALVAMLFMAVVIPVALSGIRVAAQAGETAQRKVVAARIATRVINMLRIQNELQGGQRGMVTEDGVEYDWSQESEFWSADPLSRMYLSTVTVRYRVAGHQCSVQMSTLVPPPTS
jgi:type II secretory pathway pseudopilin PulG